jgi:predicted nucleic acid-binding protein
MPSPLLLDTDVLVEFLRGRPRAAEFLESTEGSLAISAVSVAELFAGTRGKKEEAALETFLGAFEIVPIDAATAREAGKLRREFGRSHGTGLADAMIAASARRRGARLVTFNRRHFPFVKDLLVPWSRR